mmetsp:Transcript_6308/g.15146  ORF Transcript_6308/g.15146 Transcript_6308/m.15146 type:complete len:93 (-) Transcript_6308:813-1091(-)
MSSRQTGSESVVENGAEYYTTGTVADEQVKLGIEWSLSTVFATIGVFLLSGLAEIGGGWLVWQGVRNSRSWWYVLLGELLRWRHICPLRLLP